MQWENSVEFKIGRGVHAGIPWRNTMELCGLYFQNTALRVNKTQWVTAKGGFYPWTCWIWAGQLEVSIAAAQCGLPIVLITRLWVPLELRPHSSVSFILYILILQQSSHIMSVLQNPLNCNDLSCMTLQVSPCPTLIQLIVYWLNSLDFKIENRGGKQDLAAVNVIWRQMVLWG